MLNTNLQLNSLNRNVPMRSLGMNYLPASTVDVQGYQVANQPGLTPGQQQSQDVNNQTLYNIIMNTAPEQTGLSNDYAPIKTGNTTADYFLNLIPQGIHDVGEIVTGGVSQLAHPIQNIVNPIKEWSTNVAPYQSAGENLGDIVNTLGVQAAGLDAKRTAKFYKLLGEGKVDEAMALGKELQGEFVENFRKNPLIVSSILAPNLTAKGAGAVMRGTGQAVENLTKGKVAWGSAGKQAGNVAELAIMDTANEIRPVRKAAKEMVDEAKKAGGKTEANLAELIYDRENNIARPERLKALEAKYDKYLDERIKALPAEGLESQKSLSMIQYRANKTGKTFNEAEKEFIPLEEMLYDGIDVGNAAELESKLIGLRKEFKGKGNKLVKDLPEEDFTKLRNYFDDGELIALSEGEFTLKGAENYLAEALGETRAKKGLKLTPEEQIRYKENLNKISELAAAGDAVAADFIEANAGWERGTLRPTLKADVKDVAQLGSLTAEDLAGRRFAGRGSSREYGTATPEQLAKAYANQLDDVIMNIAEAKLDRHVSNALLNEAFPDGTPLVNEATKTVKYLNSDLLREGRLQSAIKSARDTAFEGGIPIDINYYNALDNQFGKISSNPFTGVLKDGYGLLKDAVLSSGTYLGGNLLSGAANAVINSNVYLFNDMLNAVKSKGALAQKLGAYRELGLDTRRFKTKGGKVLHGINRAVGGKIITDIDAMLQNSFAEIAAHANLRRQGVAGVDRLQALNTMPKMKLADTINDVRNTALINPSRRYIPQGLEAFTGMNPFFNWQVTAASSTFHTLMQHPLLSQLIASNFMGTIGFDKELQRRTNLGVKSDKQLVSYRFDNKTGEMKEISMDFLPQFTTVKAVAEPESIFRTVPLVGDLMNAAQGKNAYGKPFKRTHSGFQDATIIQGDMRYRRNPNTGVIEPISGQADEIISSLLKDISGVPNLVNKTAGPLGAAVANYITGTNNYAFYQPYGQSVFGSYSVGQQDNPSAILMSGDPMRGRAGAETVRSLLNQYEQTYYPENQAKINKAFYKGAGKLNRREMKALEQRR